MKSKLVRAPLAVAVSMLLAQTAQSAIQTLPQVDRSLEFAVAKAAVSDTPRVRIPMAALPMVFDAKALGVEGVARTHLDRIMTAGGLSKARVEAFVLSRTDTMHGGAHIVQFQRQINGIEVFREDVGLLIDAKSRLVAFRGNDRLFEPAAGKSMPSFSLGEADAAAIALGAYGIDRNLARQTLRASRNEGDYQWFDVVGEQRSTIGAVNRNPVRVKAVYFPIAEGGVVPAWYVETQAQPSSDAVGEYYAHVVSAVDGAVLFRHFQQADATLAPPAYTYRVWAESPSGLPQPNPYGRGDTPHPNGSPAYTPVYVPTTLLSLANVPFSQSATDGWLPAGATFATGNNAEAYLDLGGSDGFDGGDIRPDVTAPGVFDRAYDPNAEPGSSADQRKAASIQQFYWINWLHDDYYDAGFAEIDGNAQVDNYGRGGIGNDSIKAEGQDNTGTCAPNCVNNANMSTPGDGARPRMQMYLWSPVAPHTVTINGTDYGNGTASFGAQSFDTSSIGIVRTNPLDACTAVASVAGKIAFVDRGGCNFDLKTKNAQDAGALGVIIANVAGSPNPATAPGMGPGTPAQTGITIGTLSVNYADAEIIRAQLSDANPDVARLFRGTGVGRDGTVDGMIISHEWGHYISNRLVGNASGLSNQKGRGMGEGWADFHSLLSEVKAEDGPGGPTTDFSDSYVQGSYASGNSLYGIRRYPYSTRIGTINPLTFGHTVNGVALPTSPPPAFGANGADNSAVHNTGEVWASMLWECYAGILNDTLGATPRLTFEDARERMKEYVVGGYKLTPSAPTMTEARDAILAVIAANDIEDFEICANGFAKRGLGTAAVDAPRDSTTNAGAVEDFSAAGDLIATAAAAVPDAGCDGDDYVDLDETGMLAIDVRNVGWVSLPGGTVTVAANHAGLAFPSGNIATMAASVPYETQSVNVPIRLDTIPPSRIVQFTATPDGAIANPPGTARTVNVRVASQEFLAASATEGFNAGHFPWTTELADGATASFEWTRTELSASGNRTVIGPDSGAAGSTSLVSGPIVVGAGNFSISLTHRYQFEGGIPADPTNWDGAVLEISTDGGSTWASIGGAAYDGTINGASGNPLEGEAAFVGTSIGYPSMMADTIALGTTYANQTVRIRFRIGTDGAAGAAGWEIDSVALAGADTPFAMIVPQGTSCSPTSPIVFGDGFESD